ncbi:MAG: hypothetical protein AAFR82_01625 [Pseudomonadota bacterium]
MTRDEIIDKGVQAALTLAETEKWSAITLAAIAEKAEMSLRDFHMHADKDTLSAAVEKSFDAAMSEGSFDADETARTRLFDVIMMRFEAMEQARDGAMSFLRWRDRSFDGLGLRLKNRAATAKWALTCAGLDGANSLPRGVQVTALAWAIAQAERAWRQEMSADLSRTMAALDAELIKLEERVEWLQTRGKRKPEATPDQ